jgi:hypothetical protein
MDQIVLYDFDEEDTDFLDADKDFSQLMDKKRG